MRYAFFTIADEKGMKEMGGENLIKSIKHFHPDSYVIVIDEKDRELALNKGIANYTLIAYFGNFIQTQNFFDLLIFVGCDSLLLDRLDEVIDCDYDVGSVLNNNEFDSKLSILDVSDKYVNAGFVAVKDPAFWWHWMRVNQKYALKHQYAEQDILNILFHYGAYRTKIFDDGNSYWGTKLRGKWDKCYMKDGKVFCGDSIVKLVHYAGGAIFPKMNYKEMFCKEVVDYIESYLR